MNFDLKKYVWIVSLLAVIVCSYFMASIVARFASLKMGGDTVGAIVGKKGDGNLPPVAALPDEEALKPILERNIFDSKDTGVSPLVVAGPEGDPTTETLQPGEAVKTTLPIKLLSTFSVGLGMDGRSSAVISGGASKQDVYTVADKKQFAPDTKIIKILYDRVEFSNKGRLEYVLLEDFTKGSVTLGKLPPPKGDDKVPGKEVETKIAETAEGKFVIDRAEIEAAVSNLDKLLTQVRAVPHFKDGNPNGLKLLSVKSGSIFSKLGLKRGDILKKINGNEFDMKKSFELFNQLKNESQVAIEIERQGAPVTMEYEIR